MGGYADLAQSRPDLPRSRTRGTAKRLFDAARRDLDFNAFVDGLADAATGDGVLLHCCRHNSTGITFSSEQWLALTSLIAARRLVPLVDLAYQGLGRRLDDNATGVRTLLRAVPEALVA